MAAINERKRPAHRKRVRAELQDIFNDPTVMPNEDCSDLVVSVEEVEFGKTVRDIFVNFSGSWRNPEAARTFRERTLPVLARGETYVDLTDVAVFPSLMECVEVELQRRLGLSYRPRIRVLSDRLQDGP